MCRKAEHVLQGVPQRESREAAEGQRTGEA